MVETLDEKLDNVFLEKYKKTVKSYNKGKSRHINTPEFAMDQHVYVFANEQEIIDVATVLYKKKRKGDRRE